MSDITINTDHGNGKEPETSRPVGIKATLDDDSIPRRLRSHFEKDHGQKSQDRDDEPYHNIFRRPDLQELEKKASQQELARMCSQHSQFDRVGETKNLMKDEVNDAIERLERASKIRDESWHVPGSFQTIFDINHPQDETVHLELPINDDLETELEAFSRLTRLGNFSAAQEYFKSKLAPYLNNPYVFVHYCQMLYDKGDYLAFKELDSQAVFGKEVRSLRASKVRMDDSGKSMPPLVTSSFKIKVDEYRSQVPGHGQKRESTWSLVVGDSPARRIDGKFRSSGSAPRVRSHTPKPAKGMIVHGPNQEWDDESCRSESSDEGTVEFGWSMASQSSQDDELEPLRQNWRLLEAIFILRLSGREESREAATPAAEVWYTIAKYRFETGGIGSTEIQILALTLELWTLTIGREVSGEDHKFLQKAAEEWIDWSALYKELLIQGRIWDFHDIYLAALGVFNDRADELFFGTDDIKRSLIDDWGTGVEEEDESTNLAQLSLLGETEKFPEEAKSRAEAIMAHSPAAMKSRPFNNWIIDNAINILEGEDDPFLAYITHLRDFSGMIYRNIWLLPELYVPRKSENPGWVAPFRSPSPRATESLRLALNLAKELGDYITEARCYKLLIRQSQDPTEWFKELLDLQKSKQGRVTAHLETLLSSYLVCKDRQAKETLIEKLHQTDDWGRPEAFYLARDFIERALKRSLEGPKSTVRLRHPASFYKDKILDEDLKLFIRNNADLQKPLPPPPSQISPKPDISQRWTVAAPQSLPPQRYPPPTRRHSPPGWEGRQRLEQEEEKIESGSESTATRTKEEGHGGNKAERLLRAKTEETRAIEREKEVQDQEIKNRQPQQKTRDRPEREESLQGRLPSHKEQEGESRGKRVHHYYSGDDDVDDTQEYSYTDLVPYREFRSTQPPEKSVPRSSLLRSPNSPVSPNSRVAELEDPDKPRIRQEGVKPGKSKEIDKDEIFEVEEEVELYRLGRYGRQRSPVCDSTGIWDAFEEINKTKARKRIGKEPTAGLSGTPHPLETTARPEPSFTQNHDGINHPETRTSWRSAGNRPKAPTRFSSMDVDADGRPRPVRNKSEPGRSYVGPTISGIHIRSKGGDGGQGGPSASGIPSAAAGKTPQRPSGSPSYSEKDTGSNLLRTGPGSRAQEDVDEGKLGRESDGSLRRRKAMSTLREDLEKEQESIPPHPRTPLKARESSMSQASLDPEPGLSRRPTVTDPEVREE